MSNQGYPPPPGSEEPERAAPPPPDYGPTPSYPPSYDNAPPQQPPQPYPPYAAPPPGYPVQPGQQFVYVSEPRNGLGLASIILGILGLLFGLVPLTGFIAFGLGAVAVILALANRGRLKRGRATNRKTTWAGLITGFLAIALGIVGMVIFFDAVSDLGEDLDSSAAAVLPL